MRSLIMKSAFILIFGFTLTMTVNLNRLAGADSPTTSTQESAELQNYREQIGRVLEEQGKYLLSAEALQLMKAELAKPFAVGGKIREIPLSPRDLAAGWELFIEDQKLRAVAEITQGNVEAGTANYAVVTVRIAGEERSLAITVQPQGRRIPLSEIGKLKASDEDLRKAGLKP
jgi:hypothetical protein